MLVLILRRLAWSVPLLLVASAISFVLVSLVPGDAARTILGPDATEAQYAALRTELGLDRSLPERYWDWLRGALQGDLGSSTFNSEPVTAMLSGRVAVTLTLIGAAVLFAGAAGVGLGVLAAVRGGRLGRGVELFALLGLALPSFWVGLVLVALFAVALPLFPATDLVPFGEDPLGWARSLVLPVTTISLGVAAIVAAQVRDAMLDALNRDFVRVLRANGIPRRSIVFKHALRNAGIGVLTVLGVVFTGLLASTVLVENVFTLPGLGALAVRATLDHDLPVVQGVVVVLTLVVIAVNLLVDIAYGLLDPRVRAS